MRLYVLLRNYKMQSTKLAIRLKQAAASFEETFWSGGSLDDLYDRVGQRPVDPMSAVFAAAMREWRRSASKGLLGTPGMRLSLQQRIERVMNVTVGREMDRVTLALFARFDQAAEIAAMRLRHRAFAGGLVDDHVGARLTHGAATSACAADGWS